MSKSKIEVEARTPDAFLTTSEKLLKWVESNAAIVGGLIGAILVVGLGTLSFDLWQNWKEKKAASRIYQAQSLLNQKQTEVQKAESDRLQKMAEAMADKKQKTPSFDSAQKVDFDATFASPAAALEKAILSDLDSKAAQVAAIGLAGLYISHDKIDLALGLLEKFKATSDGPLSALLLAQKATLAMDKGEYEKALDDFEKIVQNKEVEFLHSSALLKMGLCYENLKQLDRAKETYVRVSTEYGETESARAAKGYLRLLEMQDTAKGS